MSKRGVLATLTDDHRPATSAYELPGCIEQDIVKAIRERYPFRLSQARSTDGLFYVWSDERKRGET